MKRLPENAVKTQRSKAPAELKVSGSLPLIHTMAGYFISGRAFDILDIVHANKHAAALARPAVPALLSAACRLAPFPFEQYSGLK